MLIHPNRIQNKSQNSTLISSTKEETANNKQQGLLFKEDTSERMYPVSQESEKC